MKIVIKLPEEIITAIQNGENYRHDIHTAIAQGIPYEENPQGKWIFDKEHSITVDVYKCTNCGFLTATNCYHYCPNCGAPMEEENDVQ